MENGQSGHPDDSPGDTVNPGGFSGYTAEYTYCKFYNLLMDPKEEHSLSDSKDSLYRCYRDGYHAAL